MSVVHFWIRSETKPGEHRVPIAPNDCVKLLATGTAKITVERSPHRCIKDSEYEAAGCSIVDSDTWPNAPLDAIIVGLKELPENDVSPLVHRHIFFAHCYKFQAGWADVLKRFVEGKGLLWDLEFLTDNLGRRVAAFGRAAGLVGMALGILHWCAQKTGVPLVTPLQPWNSIEDMISNVKNELTAVTTKFNIALPKVIVLGALGRCGGGCVWVCEQVGLAPTKWDINETKAGGPFPSLCGYDILLNSIYLSPNTPIPPFLTRSNLDEADASGTRTLSVVVDVSCDTSNPNHPLPFFNEGTTLVNPVLKVITPDSNSKATLPLDVIAIDHLPALIPTESSYDFSSALSPHILALADTTGKHPSQYIWDKALNIFHDKCKLLSQ